MVAKTQTVALLVTDLDNTLFDWVSIWYAGFEAQLDVLTKRVPIPISDLLEDFRVIHQRHGTSEYKFAIDELRSLIGRADAPQLRRAAHEAGMSARKATAKLYPGVREALEQIKADGTTIVGYTESMPLYTIERLAQLGLDGLLDYVFTPPNHPLPGSAPATLSLRHTKHRLTPFGELKPNPHVLRDILASVGSKPSEAIYVGDSLMKDVAMAQQAKIPDVWAKYGVAQYRVEYELLRAVTHWEESGVQREKTFAPPAPPRFVLEHSFSELLNLFSFSSLD